VTAARLLALAGPLLRGAALPVIALAILVFMVVPVPALLLDIGFIFNIALSLGVLMVALGAQRALDFSSFPTVLLFATLLRLALNVASTRVVLVDGHTGSDAAGQVIESFGHFLIGGDWLVGLLVFSILMVINLIVITKGAGRVSEVSARFTLDALPGKQMAIDADLGAGLIGPEEARARRAEVATEAEFHGSMDGASKFVKGDAVAGVIILAINILGGILVGALGHDMPMGEAAETYVLLAVGDALVAQIPALFLSIAAATVVTRVTSDHDLPGQLGGQFGNSLAWWPVAGILALLGILPGMPNLLLLPAAMMCGALAWQLKRREAAKALAARSVAPPPADPAQIGWEEVGERAQLLLDIGYGLVPLADAARDAPLMARITGLRRQLSRELGFVVPMARVRDDLQLSPNHYRLAIAGVVVAEGEVWPRDLLALDAGDAEGPLDGRPGKDPAFGLDATWIRPDQRADAVAAGYTVVDAATVIATHVGIHIRRRAGDLFGIDDGRAWLDQLRADAPQLVDALSPAPLPMATLTAILRGLLDEAVPIRDARRIGEALAIAADANATVAAQIEGLRRRIAALIVQEIAPPPLPLSVITLDSALEGLIADSLRIAAGADHPIEPQLAGQIVAAVRDAAAQAAAQHGKIALVTTPAGRPVLARLLRPHCPDLAVLSFLEVPDDRAVTIVAVVGGDPPAPPPAPALSDQSQPLSGDAA
jgi:flagellar biosynthesis protein FlhA